MRTSWVAPMSPRLCCLVVLSTLAASRSARADESAVSHGPYFHYLLAEIKGPTFNNESGAGRAVYTGQKVPTQGLMLGYQALIGKPNGLVAIGVALGFSRWKPSRLADFTVPSV